MRSLAMAGIAREDDLLKIANDKFKRGKFKDECVNSDDEDDKPNNKVHYSYNDNDFFQSED